VHRRTTKFARPTPRAVIPRAANIFRQFLVIRAKKKGRKNEKEEKATKP
jgi:hypothetical protein